MPNHHAPRLLGSAIALSIACNVDDGRPAEDPDGEFRADPSDYSGEEGTPDPPPPDEFDFLADVAGQAPPDEFELIGYVQLVGSGDWIHDEPPAASIFEVLEKAGIDPTDPDQGLVDPPIPSEDHDVARRLLVSADGRVYLERAESFETHLLALAEMPKSGMSWNEGEPVPPPNDGDLVDSDKEGDGFRQGFHGNDSRHVVDDPTSYPARAVGVQIYGHTGAAGSEWAASDGWSRRGSGTLVGPRALLTAAHVILERESPDQLVVSAGAPGVQALSFSNEHDPGPGYATNAKFSWGLRRAYWYMWPLGHYAWQNFKYDYAVMILEDLGRSPGWIRFGFQSQDWLDYRMYNSFGYPGSLNKCADSPLSDHTCGGFMYETYDQTRIVYDNTADTWIDSQPGQSGSGIYNFRANTGDRVLYLILVAGGCKTGNDCTLAKRLRGGSFDSICSTIQDWPSTFWPGQEGC